MGGWGGVTRINHINTNRASLPETPTVLYSLISNKSTSVCWDCCERKGTGEKCEKQMSKERARQSTEGITVCCKHWHSHASGPRSLPPSFFPTLHSSHGHIVLCACVCVLTNQPCCIMKTLSSYDPERKDQYSWSTLLNLFGTHPHESEPIIFSTRAGLSSSFIYCRTSSPVNMCIRTTTTYFKKITVFAARLSGTLVQHIKWQHCKICELDGLPWNLVYNLIQTVTIRRLRVLLIQVIPRHVMPPLVHHVINHRGCCVAGAHQSQLFIRYILDSRWLFILTTVCLCAHLWAS